MPAFTFRRIKDLYPSFWSKSCEFVEHLTAEVQKNPEHTQPDSESREVSVVDISVRVSNAALDIFGAAGIGHELESMTNLDTELGRAYGKVFSPSKAMMFIIALNFIFPRWLVKSLPLKRNEELMEASGVIRDMCRDLVRKSKARIAETGKTDTDILSTAISCGIFSDEDLADQLMTLLAAG